MALREDAIEAGAEVVIMDSISHMWNRKGGLLDKVTEAQAAGLPCLISDKVPIECKKTDLVFQYHLSDGAEKWADYVEKLSTIKKRDTSKEIKTAGFDICENAKWLEEFYCTKYDEIAGRKF